VKGDPDNLEIVIEGMGVCHLVPESERVPGEGIVRRFEVFESPSLPQNFSVLEEKTDFK